MRVFVICIFTLLPGFDTSIKTDGSLEVEELVGEVVLLVDDDSGLRAEMARALEQAGYHVLVAADGAQALEVLHDYDGLVDLAVTDLHMPEIDGVELARRLLELDPEIRLLFISGDGPSGLLRSGLLGPGAGARFLGKPFGVQTLLEQVRYALSSAQPLVQAAVAEE
jgi:DNA-binding response OmpR family regulator